MRKGLTLIAVLILAAFVAATVVHADSSTSPEIEPLLKQAAEKLQQGDVPGAIELYNKVIGLDADNYTAYHNLGIIYLSQQRWTDAINAFGHAQRIDPLKGEDAYLSGMAYVYTKNYEMAVLKFRRAIQFEYSSPEVYQALATTYRAMGKNSDALGAINDGLSKHAGNVMLWAAAADIHAQNGDSSKAIAAYEKIITLDSTAWWAYNRISSHFCLLDRYEDAAVRLKKSVELKSDLSNVEGFVLLSTVSYELGKLDEAVLAARRAVELFQKTKDAGSNPVLKPAFAEAMANLGYLYAERNERLKEALDLCTRASSMSPGNSSILDSLGWVQFKNGLASEAIATLQKAQKEDPNDGWSHYHLAVIYQTQKQKDKAVEQYKLAAKCATTSRKLKSSLAQLKKQLGI